MSVSAENWEVIFALVFPVIFGIVSWIIVRPTTLDEQLSIIGFSLLFFLMLGFGVALKDMF